MQNTDLMLPATTSTLLHGVVNPALELLPVKMTSPEADVMMLSIAKQESELRTRVQDGNGPAHGLWQFEEGGAVKGVLGHRVVGNYALTICNLRSVMPEKHAVWIELARDDILAACFARLLLYTDAGSLPDLGDAERAWEYYADNWRPGRPRKEKWQTNYSAAIQAATGAGP